MRVILILLVITLTSCASARTQRLADYKLMTKDICKDNHHEIDLAQKLYISYVNRN